jgi:hypothetical protein
MILDMQGKQVQDTAPSIKKIEILIDPRLEDERLEDFVNNYLVPFMNQLQVPVTNITIHE